MARSTSVPAVAGVIERLRAFVLERFPFALPAVQRVTAGRAPQPQTREAWMRALENELRAVDVSDLPETTPGVSPTARWKDAVRELLDAVDGFFAREAIAASLTREEKLEIMRGMVLMRALDNRLKLLYLQGDVKYGAAGVQGKGFRSLGQEAIYAAGIRLRRGSAYRDDADGWRGDVVCPLIRDNALVLAMHNDPWTIRMILNAQIGKAGPPMDGRDIHVADWGWGILPPTAPLGINPVNIAGVAMAFAREGSERVAVSLIGEGASSLGEWHEAINACAVRKLPAVFCIQNNQTALSTPVNEQSVVRVFADKAAGYGVAGITTDGTDPEAIAAAFTWAADRARAGLGPTLIELVSMRMCGHAHHDDMLYLGKEPPASWECAPVTDGAYVNREQYEYWSTKDPISGYAAKLLDEGIMRPGDLDALKHEAEATVEREVRALIDAPWPEPKSAGERVLAGEPARVYVEPLDPSTRLQVDLNPELPPLEPGLPFDRKGMTFLEAVTAGVADALRADPRVFVYGEDVGGLYGGAFLLLRPLLKEFGDRIINSPIAENAIFGIAIGAALAGQRPIAEVQFNDFAATGFNQLVNNAAKQRYRWGASIPMVVRMPWGGLRHAGPYHSQNTEAWFYRTPGLKIVVPSTPEDARALMASAVADPDPVLYFEHIALYRDPRIKQLLPQAATPIPIGKAALRRSGSDLAIVSYGAYVHVAMRVAERLAADGIQASVLDLRSLAPLDKDAVLRVARHCSRVLIVHEDTRTGSIGESLAAIVQEEAFESLDAPVRIVGALDTPVPYSPPLEEYFLPSEERVERAARLLVTY
ncbi:MAG TPA: thiamine pyrophosphate-dependent enzyme [Vicinamibacterales bacterium]|nr:thiamine pyrophosphate-dependent enzyme [Vicinamibacterales bacterium]